MIFVVGKEFHAEFVFMSVIILRESLTVTISDCCLFTVVCNLLPSKLEVSIDYMWLSFS